MRNEILKQQDSWIFSPSRLWGNTSSPPPSFYLFLSVCLSLHDQKNSEIMMGNKKGWCLLASFMQKKEISRIKWGMHTHTKHVLLQSASIRFYTVCLCLTDTACTVSFTVASSNMTLAFMLTVGLCGVASFIVTPLLCATAKGVVKATVVTTAVNICAVYHAIKTIRMTVTHMERVSDGERERGRERNQGRNREQCCAHKTGCIHTVSVGDWQKYLQNCAVHTAFMNR